MDAGLWTAPQLQAFSSVKHIEKLGLVDEITGSKQDRLDVNGGYLEGGDAGDKEANEFMLHCLPLQILYIRLVWMPSSHNRNS